MAAIRLLVVDDHALFRRGIIGLLRAEPGFEVVGEAACCADALRIAAEQKPDLVLMDLYMPGTGGVETTRRLLEMAPEVGVVVLTASETDADLVAAIQAGARGYILKDADADELFAALRRVSAGGAAVGASATPRLLGLVRTMPASPAPHAPLTGREQEVLDLLVLGAANPEIARRLFISENTVKTHVAHILEKLQLRSRSEIVSWARHNGRVAATR